MSHWAPVVKSVYQAERGIIFRKTFSGTRQKFRITQLKTKTLQHLQELYYACLVITCCRMLTQDQCVPHRDTRQTTLPHTHTALQAQVGQIPKHSLPQGPISQQAVYCSPYLLGESKTTHRKG